jgi:NTE family protein
MTYGMMDFDQYDSIMAFGERVAREHYKELKALADSLNAIRYKPIKKYNTTPLTHIQVDSLVIRDNKKMQYSYFHSIFGGYQHRKVSIDELEKDIRLTYGSGYFDRVTYELEYRNGKTNLVIHAVESGAGAVAAGVHYDGDYGINFNIAGTFRNVLGTNSKLFADVNIAVNPRIRVNYLLGLGGKGSVGASAEFYTFKVSTYDKDVKENNFDLTNYKGSLFFNYNFRNMVNLKTGFEYEYFRFRQEINIDSALNAYSDFSSYGNLFVCLNVDTRDRVNYPTSGIRLNFKGEYVMPFSKNWSSDLFSNSAVFFLKYDHNISLARRFVLQPGLFAGVTVNHSGTAPIQHLFGTGGLTTDNYIESYVPFTGLHFIQDFGSYAFIARMKLQYNVYKKIYVKLLADAGANETEADELFASRNFLMGYGITAGYDSFIGPVEISLMGSNINPGMMLFFNVGYWF